METGNMLWRRDTVIKQGLTGHHTKCGIDRHKTAQMWRLRAAMICETSLLLLWCQSRMSNICPPHES